MGRKRRLLDSGQNEKVGELVRKVMLPHEIYVEPFFTEGEVLFYKKPSAVEVIGDSDGRIIEFYLTVRTYWKELAFLFGNTLYADSLYKLAERIDRREVDVGQIYRAWAVWVCYNRQNESHDAWLNYTSAWMNNVRVEGNCEKWMETFSGRLKNVHISDKRPADIIREADSETTFHYIRPRSLKEVKDISAMLGDIKGNYIFHYADRRVMERIAAKHSLNKETDEAGNMVFTNYKRQKSLFENI